MGSILVITALGYMNIPYRWGGQNYLGIDCSGLAINILRDVGVLLPDMTAQGLHRWVKAQENKTSKIKPGCFLFFGKNIDSISHVAVAINKTHMVEAGGAGRNSLNMSVKELAQRDARVRIRPIKNRKDLVSCIYVDVEKLLK